MLTLNQNKYNFSTICLSEDNILVTSCHRFQVALLLLLCLFNCYLSLAPLASPLHLQPPTIYAPSTKFVPNRTNKDSFLIGLNIEIKINGAFFNNQTRYINQKKKFKELFHSCCVDSQEEACFIINYSFYYFRFIVYRLVDHY